MQDFMRHILTCCLSSVFAVFACFASFIAPCFWRVPTAHALDELTSRSFKGPNADALPARFRGLWYLSGNQERKRCSPEARRNATMCGPGGWKRSGIFLLDTSRCERYRQDQPFVCNMGVAAGFVDAKMATQTMLFRSMYKIVKDSEFERRDPGRFEGAAHLSILGLSACTWSRWIGVGAPLCPYRVTLHDEGDGSKITRLTWWGIDDAHKPQPRRKVILPSLPITPAPNHCLPRRLHT